MAVDVYKYIGKPVGEVKSLFEQMGFSVDVLVNSKPKIKTDYQLVVNVREVDKNKIELIVGEFLINIEDKDGLV